MIHDVANKIFWKRDLIKWFKSRNKRISNDKGLAEHLDNRKRRCNSGAKSLFSAWFILFSRAFKKRLWFFFSDELGFGPAAFNPNLESLEAELFDFEFESNQDIFGCGQNWADRHQPQTPQGTRRAGYHVRNGKIKQKEMETETLRVFLGQNSVEKLMNNRK